MWPENESSPFILIPHNHIILHDRKLQQFDDIMNKYHQEQIILLAVS